MRVMEFTCEVGGDSEAALTWLCDQKLIETILDFFFLPQNLSDVLSLLSSLPSLMKLCRSDRSLTLFEEKGLCAQLSSMLESDTSIVINCVLEAIACVVKEEARYRKNYSFLSSSSTLSSLASLLQSGADPTTLVSKSLACSFLLTSSISILTSYTSCSFF